MAFHGLKYKIPVFIGLGSLAVLLPTTALNFEQNQWLELHVVYWAELAMLCGWIFLAVKYIRANRVSLRDSWRRYALLLLLSLCLTIILFAVIPREFRIFSKIKLIQEVDSGIFKKSFILEGGWSSLR